MKNTGQCFTKRLGVLPLISALLVLAACSPAGIGEKPGSPRDALPAHITELTELGVGVRPAWSGDGSRFLYLDALVGDVYEYDLASGSSQRLTAHFKHHGFARAHYLANGDLLLCGPSEWIRKILKKGAGIQTSGICTAVWKSPPCHLASLVSRARRWRETVCTSPGRAPTIQKFPR